MKLCSSSSLTLMRNFDEVNYIQRHTAMEPVVDTVEVHSAVTHLHLWLVARRRASSVNLSLEKLTEAADRRAESLERQLSTEGPPPPKPPHTYYNKHRYPAGGEVRAPGFQSRKDQPPSGPPPAPPDAQDPPNVTPQVTDDHMNKDKARRSVFRKFFSKK
ncbi:hypothetical protein F2P81_002940 [Scophthalmus maximus]|uniref:Uncharacterized protein n=1 Tax=Scophthalmus maximus TaxID=52904 RepID=A0A6A4TP67_SCOMX|nr:hypothetical protein F2P81_002940 [Scophthalmus maximus]